MATAMLSMQRVADMKRAESTQEVESTEHRRLSTMRVMAESMVAQSMVVESMIAASMLGMAEAMESMEGMESMDTTRSQIQGTASTLQWHARCSAALLS